jgi:hypothetical protein
MALVKRRADPWSFSARDAAQGDIEDFQGARHFSK